jgi:hypothetical protein
MLLLGPVVINIIKLFYTNIQVKKIVLYELLILDFFN